jgi:hypothetical protein
MNNLYRELAPITDSAWAQLEEEAKRTFATYVAGRRIVDVDGPGGPGLAAVNTGHLSDVAAPADGVIANLRESQPLVRLRVPFTLSREEIDSVERGAQDADWQPLKDAAKQIAFAEDRAIFEGYTAAGITGLRDAASNTALSLPADQRHHRARLPDPAADRAGLRRRDPVGAGHRRGVPAIHPGRRLHAQPGPGPVHRLPVARRRLGAAVLPGGADLPGLHDRGDRGHQPGGRGAHGPAVITRTS